MPVKKRSAAIRKRVKRITKKSPQTSAKAALALAKKRQAKYKKSATKKASTKKQAGPVKKRVNAIKKRGEAYGSEAWKLAKKREKKSIQKDKTKTLPRYLWSKKRKANNPKAKAPKGKPKAKDTRNITLPVEKDKPGFGRVKNPNSNKLRFAKRPGTKRRIR